MTKDKYKRSSCNKTTTAAEALEEEQDFDEDLSTSSDGGLLCQPHQRNAANARERARMRVLSKAFCRLKTTLPWVPADTKLSKLDTLRLATSYISHLRAILNLSTADNANDRYSRPINLSWPFNNHFYFQTSPISIDQREDIREIGKFDWIDTAHDRKFPSSNSSRKHNTKFSHCFCLSTEGREIEDGRTTNI